MKLAGIAAFALSLIGYFCICGGPRRLRLGIAGAGAGRGDRALFAIYHRWTR